MTLHSQKEVIVGILEKFFFRASEWNFSNFINEPYNYKIITSTVIQVDNYKYENDGRIWGLRNLYEGEKFSWR